MAGRLSASAPAPATARAPGLAACLALCLLVGACSRGPEGKVQRWATEVLPAVVEAPEVAAEEEADAAPAEAPSEPAPEELEARMKPCQRLVHRACVALGPWSEECLQGRRELPSERPPEWEAACAEVLAEHHTLIETDGEPPRGRNACRQLELRLCEDMGPNTFACREAREDANRLRRQKRTASCLGALLLREAGGIFTERRHARPADR